MTTFNNNKNSYTYISLINRSFGATYIHLVRKGEVENLNNASKLPLPLVALH